VFLVNFLFVKELYPFNLRMCVAEFYFIIDGTHCRLKDAAAEDFEI